MIIMVMMMMMMMVMMMMLMLMLLMMMMMMLMLMMMMMMVMMMMMMMMRSRHAMAMVGTMLRLPSPFAAAVGLLSPSGESTRISAWAQNATCVWGDLQGGCESWVDDMVV